MSLTTTDTPLGRRAARDLSRYALLSIAAAVLTISLKTVAWRMTGSVGLLSDAAESVVNLIAAVVAFVALRVAIKPADKNHHFGHSKAEYFSAAVEGMMIFVAATVIVYSAVLRFMHPAQLQNLDIGIPITAVASVINGGVAFVLLRAAKKYRSITLEADGKHLLTDVWTSVGVIAGVLLVPLVHWPRLDPLVAMAVGVNILIVGSKLISASAAGLMDISLPKEENDLIRELLDSYRTHDVHFHALRTRESGHKRFLNLHMQVPGAWTVQQGFDQVERVTDGLHQLFPDLHVIISTEPLEDERSYADGEI